MFIDGDQRVKEKKKFCEIWKKYKQYIDSHHGGHNLLAI